MPLPQSHFVPPGGRRKDGTLYSEVPRNMQAMAGMGGMAGMGDMLTMSMVNPAGAQGGQSSFMTMNQFGPMAVPPGAPQPAYPQFSPDMSTFFGPPAELSGMGYYPPTGSYFNGMGKGPEAPSKLGMAFKTLLLVGAGFGLGWYLKG